MDSDPIPKTSKSLVQNMNIEQATVPTAILWPQGSTLHSGKFMPLSDEAPKYVYIMRVKYNLELLVCRNLLLKTPSTIIQPREIQTMNYTIRLTNRLWKQSVMST